MASDWTELQLGDVIEVKHGWPFRSELFSDELTGLPIVVSIGNFRYTGGFRFGSTTVREYRGEYPREYELSAGEILVIMTCQTAGGEILGIPARVPSDGRTYLHNQRLGRVVVRDSSRIDESYLYWLLLSPAFNRELYRSASGTKILHTAPTRIAAVRVCLPSLEEQRAIAHILGALDDKIELNRRMNETLETMARAIFKSWFVDFDPVRAKAAGRKPVGLAPHIADLFPDAFEDSELGEIPKGWRVGTIGDLALLNPESWSKATRPDVISYVDLTNTKWGRIEDVTAYVQDDAPSRAQRVLRPRDTIVGTVRPGNGSYALILREGLTGSTGFASLRPREDEYAEFVYLAATAMDNIELLSHLADGGAYPAVRPEVVAATQVIRADHQVLVAFNEAVEPLLQRTAQAESESGTLAAIRDALLPKLISGELPITNAASIIGRSL